MRQYENGDDGQALVHLARQVDDLKTQLGRLSTLQADVDVHTRTLGDLTDALRVLSDDLGAQDAIPAPAPATAQPSTASVPTGEPAPDWLSVTDPATAIAWLSGLTVWVERIWTRYTPIAGCWMWHPVVVAELLVTWQQWQVATGDGAGPDLLAAWHDRWRPGVTARTTRWLSACERAFGLHVDGPNPRWIYDTSYLDEVAYWWATTHGTTTPATRRDPRDPRPVEAPAPGLTPAPRDR